MNKDTRTFILSIVLYIPLSIWVSRFDSREDIGIYTLQFLNMIVGVCVYLLCLAGAYWFVKPEGENK